MTVKFRQHTRLVNVPVKQNSDWLNSLKVAVVNKFRDLLSPDGKEAEVIFEKMKNNLLFQVYNADHGEFIDLTKATLLTEKAKLRLQMTPMTYGEADGTAPSIKELVSLLICIATLHIVTIKKDSMLLSSLSQGNMNRRIYPCLLQLHNILTLLPTNNGLPLLLARLHESEYASVVFTQFPWNLPRIKFTRIKIVYIMMTSILYELHPG